MSGLSLSGSGLSITGGSGGAALELGTTVITGGSTGHILYDNGGLLGEYSITGTGDVVMSNNPTLTGGGTVTTNNPALAISQTWNAAAVSFKAVTIDVTALAAYSGGPPYPAAFQVNNAGSPQIAIGIDGWFYPKGSYALMGSSGDGQALNFYQPVDPVHQIKGAGFYTRLNNYFGWGPADSASKTPVTSLTSPSAAVVEVNNGTRVSSGGSYGEIDLATVQLAPAAAPAAPALAGAWVLYVDSGDGNKLKAKASTGTVVTIGTP